MNTYMRAFNINESIMINILYCNPNSGDIKFEYLPKMYGVLKGAVDDVPSLGDNVNWHRPIYYRANNIKLSKYNLKELDIFACSVYVWNRETNYKLMHEIKKENPNCLTVVGGPEPYYRDKHFFEKNPQIDIVVKQDGEYPFPKIVEEVINGTKNFKQITGLVTKNNGDTGPATLTKDFTRSYFHDYAEEFIELAYDSKKFCYDDGVGIMLESDRGCPFGCTFCDWGSATMQKIRKIPLEIVYKDIEFAGEASIGTIDIINANFGIFARDIKITEKIAEVKEKFGSPERIHIQHTKTKLDHTKKILKIARSAKLLTSHVLPLQTTNSSVLEAIDRKNIPYTELIALAKETGNENIPIESIFIIGMPGDTYKSFQKNFWDVMEQGLLENFQTPYFQILPNSPANDPAYREKWKIKTISRHAQQRRRRKAIPNEGTSISEFAVSSSTFNIADYIKMYIFSAIMRSFHGFGFTRYISVYLRRTHDISYEEFYTKFLEEFFMNKKYPAVYSMYSKINEKINGFIFSSNQEQYWEYEIDGVPTMYDVDEYLSIQLLFNFSEFKKELIQYMQDTYDIENLYSVVKFNLDLIVTPDYDYTKGFIFTTDLNWKKYFKTAKLNWWTKSMKEPKKIKFTENILQKAGNYNNLSEFTWLDKTGNNRITAYVNTVIQTTYRRGDSLLFNVLRD